MAPNRDLIRFLASRFGTYNAARALWQDAGGNVGEIHDQDSSIDRWTDLVGKADDGAISRINLTLAALERYPKNEVLLADLREQLPPALRIHVSTVLDELSRGQNVSPERAEELLSPVLSDPQGQAALVVEAYEVDKKDRGWLKSVQTIFTNAGTQATNMAFNLLTKYLTGEVQG